MSKVALIISDLNMAGAQKMIVDLMPFLLEEYPESCLIVLGVSKGTSLEKIAEKKGIRIVYMGKRSGNFAKRKLDTWTYLCRTLKNEKADILFVHLDYMYTWIYSAVFRKRIIETIHTQPYRLRTRWISFMYSYLKKRNLIRPVLLTKSGAQEFASVFKEDRKLDVIPNAIDIDKYSVSNNESEIVRISFIARFHAIKNHAFLLNAFKIALKEEPGMQLSLAGEGELLEETKALAIKLGIIDNVSFLGHVDNIPQLLSNTDIFAISSVSESFSLVLVEAMAAGLPIIATNVGGMRDIIKDNGMMIDSDDVDGFANAIVLLAHDKDLRKKMGNRSREIAKGYALEKIASDYIKLFEDECGRR